MQNVLVVEDSSRRDDRDMFFILLRKALHRLDDSADLLIICRFIEGLRHMIRVSSKLSELFPGKSEMTARAWSFHYDEIRCCVVLSVPHPADHKSRFHRGNDGRDHGTPLFLFRTSVLILRLRDKFRHVDRETGAGDDHVRSGFHRLFHIGRVLLRCNHDIKAQNPLGRFLPGFLKLGMDRSQIRRHRIFSEILILKSDLGCGNDSDSARLSDCSG